ncbi:hypothetical protein DW352_02760 [Pseudolabrys taiwanensis]|uniref:Uncharacterized protein n=1 Tax=Pseudolabrys taiwanensis TaxID=331696 RepID=A0A345ZRI6_9HYPH|nr:hypothetical protein [Pseudolabrys taiwanensis]AXK79533.1 hypothetical protein DW352_02760 [Pseudolabrys taiwanensis]
MRKLIVIGALAFAYPAAAQNQLQLDAQHAQYAISHYGELLYFQKNCPELNVRTDAMRTSLINGGVRVDRSLEAQNAVNIAFNTLALSYQSHGADKARICQDALKFYGDNGTILRGWVQRR